MVATDYKRRVRRVSRNLTRKREERGGETLTAPEQRARARAVIQKRDAGKAEGKMEGTDKPRPGKEKNVKHVNVTKPEDRATEGTVSKEHLRTKTAARIKADKPSLTGKARQKRVTNQTRATVKRVSERGLTVTGTGKKKKK